MCATLTWLRRMKVALDADFNVKIYNFRLAKYGPTRDQTEASTRVTDTYGYVVTEYVMTGHHAISLASM
ncbi:hypothetical protein FXO38_11116 [Capsicum annuum]|nr:hypothetical protein FXO37_27297 [Capsicum annuum]KAF3662523.1 hypothetical protein FXO38_11116 [Capsicum annuum]